MAEESQVSEDVPKRGRVAMHIPMIVKTIEVVLSIFAIGLLVDPLNSFQKVFNKPRMKLDDAATIYVTVAGYILINTLFLISHMLGDRIPKRTLILFASVGALLHIVAGSLIVHNWRKIHGPSYHVQNNEIYPSKQYMDMMISASVFTFVNAVTFTIEVFLIVSFGPGIPTTISATGEEYIVPLAKPIRIVQFLLVTLLFALTIYTISRKSPYENIEGTLLTLLYGSFLFIAIIDIISQFGGDPIPDTPMFLFGVVGTVLFLIATFGVLFNYMRESHEEGWRLIATMALSAACSLLYLLDVLVIFLYGY